MFSMGTVGIEMIRRLTEAHVKGGGQFVSAPVFGRPESAATASLSILAAGPADVIDRISIVFKAISKRVFVVGEKPFQANVVKLCGNFLLLSAIEGLAESLAFACEQGVTPRLLLKVMTETLFTAPFY